jgi:hypothetical protein
LTVPSHSLVRWMCDGVEGSDEAIVELTSGDREESSDG